MKKILILSLLVFSSGLVASKQGPQCPPPPKTNFNLPQTSGSINIQRQSGMTTGQGSMQMNLGPNTSIFGGGWNMGQNRGVFGGINRRFKEEARYIILNELGLLD